ncbi:polysaccharide biosynthesis/export family protein [Mucilaginibacter sabulilitoris]|uniref:Polysaccharide biosynthesis/export family protein n=1 Tax=Mucilaginibacter sabulilitoris TaxID=1173583 RepID=A0ABZ0TR44_9SPHI|nr:polysaccharide biosynthesis/export family protein [Mucilaginibacter sabulilitoris]WPU95610.1 polysaccharide biosynthesis/export family protein [Mucilaginibacter sabulilitoris]
MRKYYLFNSFFILFILLISSTIFSCSSTKNIKYFQDIPDSGQMKTIAKAEYTEPVIQIDDIVTILVQTVDPLATNSITLGNVPIQSTSSVGLGASSLNQQISSGYLVNKQGFVDVPILGHIKVVGLTTTQTRELVLAEASKYFKEPTVIVRYANFKISVTGEVAKPGQYTTPNERVSVLDALAMAGDLTIYGKRDNILLVRENADGTKSPYRINLNRSDLMSSAYFYLRQNDIIYVEPNKSKVAATDINQAKTLAIIGSALSVLIVLFTRINF